jgi:hypothetical protein
MRNHLFLVAFLCFSDPLRSVLTSFAQPRPLPARFPPPPLQLWQVHNEGASLFPIGRQDVMSNLRRPGTVRKPSGLGSIYAMKLNNLFTANGAHNVFDM